MSKLLLPLSLSLLALCACDKPKEAAKSEAQAVATAPSSTKAVNLKAGLWDVTMKNDMMPMTFKGTICFGDNFADDLAKLSKDKPDANCQKATTENANGVLRVNVSCDHKGEKMTMQAEVTQGDDSHFQQSVTVSFDPPKSGMSGFKQTVDGTFVGPCPKDRDVGSVKMEMAR